MLYRQQSPDRKKINRLFWNLSTSRRQWKWYVVLVKRYISYSVKYWWKSLINRSELSSAKTIFLCNLRFNEVSSYSHVQIPATSLSGKQTTRKTKAFLPAFPGANAKKYSLKIQFEFALVCFDDDKLIVFRFKNRLRIRVGRNQVMNCPKIA